MKQFKPLGDRVLIKPIKQEETKTKSGIIISESMTQSQKVNGEVIEISYDPDMNEEEENYTVCELSCEFMTMQTFIIEE